MLQELKEEASRTRTENGAATLCTTGSECLDLFAAIGALRNASEEEIVLRFLRAYAEEPDLAMKLLFYARDIRGGIGERRVFRVALRALAEEAPDSVIRNLCFIPEFGRCDDWLPLLDTACADALLALIRRRFEEDCAELAVEGRPVSLLAKWLPSVNASNGTTIRHAKRIACALHLTQEQYRKTLSALRARIRILENYLRTRDYSFRYADQPAKAMLKYRKAFSRNDKERYNAYPQDVAEGRATLHTAGLTPYEIIAPLFRGADVSAAERAVLDTTWKAQEDFTNGENALIVEDGSGSMYCGCPVLPIAAAISLGIYFAERNTGAFRNHFITFSENPRLVAIKGQTIADKVRYCMGFNEPANTNLSRVFELILRTAVRHQLPQEQLPRRLYIITDMEFDCCTEDASLTNFEAAKRRFGEAGYRLPEVVFWNIDSRQRQQPVSANEQGVTLLSGLSPRLFSFLTERDLPPERFMRKILLSDRYAPIVA